MDKKVSKKISTQKKLEKINASPELWLKNFVKISTNNGDYIPFQINAQQKYFVDNMIRFNVISKARQIGFTTLSLGLCLHYAVTRPRTNYMIVSYKQESSTLLFETLKDMNASLPRGKFPFPDVIENNRGKLRFNNGSSITLATAGGKDIGRGATFEYILLSEFAFYGNQEKTLLSSEQALAKSTTSKIVIETTSNGFNYYQKVFMNAYRGNSKYKAFFFPFYSSAYKEQFKIEYDEAELWYIEDNNHRRLSKNDLEQDEIPLVEGGANLRQIMWRRWKLLDMSLNDFYQEFPSTPNESFISSGNNVFDTSKIVERLRYAPDPMNENELKTITHTLLRYVGKGLKIYQLPVKNARYYGGVDTASGSGADNSTMTIMSADGVEVCSFASNKVPVYEFARVVNDLGKFYNYTFLVVERNSFGTPILERLRKEYNYLNLYKHKRFNQQTGKKQMLLGWNTDNVSKNIMITDLKERFELDMIVINDKDTLEQMQIFVEKTNGGTGNSGGHKNHDDSVISLGLAVQGIKTNKWYV